MTDIDLDGVDLSTAVPEAIVLSVERPLVGRRRHENVDVPGKAGSWVFPEEPGDRVLAVELDLQGVSFDDRRDSVRRLADWCDLGAVAQMIVDDEPDRFHEVLLDDDPAPAEWLVRAVASLKFRAGPYALSIATFEEEIIGSAGNADGSITLPDDVAAEPVIELDPDGTGYIDTFTLTVNDDTLTVLQTFDVNEIVTISSISDTVTAGANGDVNLTGAYDTADVRMSDVSGRFPMLVPGNNDITLQWDGTATTVIVRIMWRRRYR